MTSIFLFEQLARFLLSCSQRCVQGCIGQLSVLECQDARRPRRAGFHAREIEGLTSRRSALRAASIFKDRRIANRARSYKREVSFRFLSVGDGSDFPELPRISLRARRSPLSRILFLKQIDVTQLRCCDPRELPTSYGNRLKLVHSRGLLHARNGVDLCPTIETPY